jgi:hypothetical protein
MKIYEMNTHVLFPNNNALFSTNIKLPQSRMIEDIKLAKLVHKLVKI